MTCYLDEEIEKRRTEQEFAAADRRGMTMYEKSPGAFSSRAIFPLFRTTNLLPGDDRTHSIRSELCSSSMVHCYGQYTLGFFWAHGNYIALDFLLSTV